MNLENTILGWIRENCGTSVPAGELTAETGLLEGGILDSLQIVNLITFIEDHVGVSIEMEEVVPENFETVGHIIHLIERSTAHSRGDA